MSEKDFISKWTDKIKSELKNFPSDFADLSSSESIDLPAKFLILAPPLFGSYELTDSEGNAYYMTDDLLKAKYILYANRSKPAKLNIPADAGKISDAVKSYEKYLDSLLREVNKDFGKTFPESKNLLSVSNQIFNSLNLQRH